jgi:hypothetical protein
MRWPGLLGMFLSAALLGLRAQVPLERMDPQVRALVQSVLLNPDFTFETRTPPAKVRLETMDKLFDRPRLAAAMWRYCQFAPRLFATELPNQGLTVDDARGLRGTLTLAHRAPGQRIYFIDGRVERGRMGNPMAVGARMVVIYRYWDGPRGFESALQTWTTLDSALLAFISRPFRNYIQRRQQEFIAYINHNIALGGEFAMLHPEDFRGPLQAEGDRVALRQFTEVFGRGRNGNGGRGGGR